MRKRERENPCGICGHYHKYEEGEMCPVCGHRMPASSEKHSLQGSAFPSEILKDFLFLGSYDNASRAELLKTLGISRILNTVPACQNLYKNSFTYHCLEDEKSLQFAEAIHFLEQCEKEKARVLVHCMSGRSRSPAVVIAYLMRSKGWRLQQSYQWVIERRPQVKLSTVVHQQLQEYEQKLLGVDDQMPAQVLVAPDLPAAFGFGFAKAPDTTSLPVFSQQANSSIFDGTGSSISPGGIVFGAGRPVDQTNTSFGVIPSNGTEASMDSS